MARSRKSKTPELLPQPDPKAPLDSGHFLGVAQGVLDLLTKDLLARADESPAITAGLKALHQHDKQKGLTADGYPVWRRHVVVQIAAAWLLSCVFVRTLEDRGLLARNRLAGPGALDAERAFSQLAPHLGLREYLLTIFTELEHFPAARRLFDREHNLAWRLAPSPEGAKALVGLFRGGDPEQPHFRFGQASTRFLGDLYQDLSEEVRKRYALLQTPDFVEEFILDRTLEPAIVEFGLPATTIIDPTCGSGHFLLGAFERLFNHWSAAEPGESDERHVEKALAAVHGVDINAYAVFIAEFRLTLAALEKLGVGQLREAPVLGVNVVVADSLLHNYTRGQAGFADMLGQDAGVWFGEEFVLQDGDAAKRTLGMGFSAVVGNPPYITVKDKALRDKYRAMYSAAHREYSLSVPFMQRFFELAGEGGFVGQITSNSFMKREFGKKLIEEYLPTVDLQSIINTSGAFVPGHGTPTVILFGRARAPVGKRVHAVLARRGEPSTPADPAQGEVWSSIRDHGGEVGFENEYVTVACVERSKLGGHPWSLEGGGAAELKSLIESRTAKVLGDITSSIGFMCITKQDDIFCQPSGTFSRWRCAAEYRRPFVIGELVRDWCLTEGLEVFFPYNDDAELQAPSAEDLRVLWPFRTTLESRAVFGGNTFRKAGKRWYEYGQIPAGRTRGMSIGFAFVATHNHFVLERGGKVFKQTAPIIKLPDDATEDDHLALLAYLNSSTACFWMKQVFFDKGNRGEGGGTTSEDWEKFFEHDGTKLAGIPVPHLNVEVRTELIALARSAGDFATKRDALDWKDAFSAAENEAHLEARLAVLSDEARKCEERIRASQERIDWIVYRVFGLSESIPPIGASLAPSARFSDRRFAAEAVRTGSRRYFELCRLPTPEDVLGAPPVKYIESATAMVDGSHSLAIIEQPRYKRTYREGFRPRDLRALAQEWLSERVESGFVAGAELTAQSAEALRDALSDSSTKAVCAHVLGAELSSTLLIDLLSTAAVPFAAALRFTEAGLEKHAAWQHTWDLQRREDANEKVGDIPVPPKYDQKDFRSASYWPLRGKLDVPKERFIAYPYCESDNDPQPLYGWAGWNHAQRAEALLALYTERKDDEAWPAERLTPILAGILELIPWMKQWHNEPDEQTGERLGDAYDSWLGEELRIHGLTRTDLANWRPPARGRGKKKSSKKNSSKKTAEPS